MYDPTLGTRCDNDEVIDVSQVILSEEKTAVVLRKLYLMKMSYEAEAARYARNLAIEQLRPHKLYPVMIYHDGVRWVCSYGVFGDAYTDYLPAQALGQSGVEAFGSTPSEACENFDRLWLGRYREEAPDDESDTGRDQDDEL
jgi:hypothetical protein